MSLRDLYMRISDVKFIKKLLMPFLILTFFLLGEHFLGSLLIPVNNAVIFKDQMAAIKEEGRSADILFLGTSRVYHCFAPEVFEEELGLSCVVNGGTATQRPDSSYLFLKDLDRSIRPKCVVFSLQWSSLLEDATEAQTLESTLMVYDRMTGAGRAECFLKKFGTEVWPELFPLYRYRYDFRADKIRQIAQKWEDYKKNGYVPDTQKDYYYLDKGFVYATKHMKNGNVPIMDEGTNVFSKESIVAGYLKSLDDICTYCKEHDIRLYLITPPMAMMNLYHVEGYQEAVSFFQEYAEKNGLIYHNLNYLKDREEWLPDEMMTDYVHLSGEAGMEVSRRYARILEIDEKGGDTSGFFYRDLDELKEHVRRVVAVKTKNELNGDTLSLTFTSLQNDDVQPVYRVEISVNGARYETVVDWTEKDRHSFLIPDGEVSIRVSAACAADDAAYAWQEYKIR